MADWSSLPSELVRRIADCLLSTNELDCYMDFRAVCPSWRSATDDPTNSSDLRYRALHWIIIDEIFQSDARLLVNTATGRVVRKDLPLLRRFDVVATTHDISAAALGGYPIPNLMLLSDRCYERYIAAVDSDAFNEDSNHCGYIVMRLLIDSGAGAWMNSEERFFVLTPAALAKKLFVLRKLFDIEPVAALGDIGDHAIFVGYGRCVCVSADKFPTVDANCIYYLKHTNSSLKIYKYDLQVEKEEMVSEAVGSLNPATSSFANFPFTIVQLLSSYTINVRESQLPKEKFQFPDWFDALSGNFDEIFNGMNFDYLAEITDDDGDEGLIY
ncbi:unnamed protein product [Alopecurus aequalis]